MTKTALVTGVCGGIGSAIAERLGGTGWDVIGIDRETRPPVGCGEFVSHDIADWRGLPAALSELLGGRDLDVLVNNAGIQVVSSISAFEDDDLDAVFRVNTFAAFAAIRAVAPNLATRAGSVVNISSVHAVATSKGMSIYAASKAALVGMTRAAAVDLADSGIRVNAVLPGAIDTPMLRAGAEAREGGTAEGMRKLASATPLGRVGLAREVADLVEYLADSERSSFVTGQTFVIDGGATARLGTE
jgi:NAD(P)-dependent dehydrogenase (short-subunit alcohol dehydrogenase family)